MLAFGMPGGLELGVIALVGLLIFGRRLPSIARSMGSSIIEFKKGLRDIKDDAKLLEDQANQIKEEIKL